MKQHNIKVAIFMASFISITLPISSSASASATVNDVTATDNETVKQLQNLTRQLANRNKMQIRLQNQLDELSQELNQVKGQNELFEYKFDQMEKRQREMLITISDLESRKPVAEANAETPVVEKTEQSAYQSAVDLVLKNKEYDQAIVAFNLFVVDYPSSALVANAQYWLGQLLYKQKQRKEARAAFLVVVDKFPKSNKRAESMLKIGIIDESSSNKASAKKYYESILKEYASSSAAGLASSRLKAL
ncbi:MAG TPA: tol-pal system protein YbgF [Psychromonas hadalis]|nr:tol-pal system protein YbgF [Psychromonas hadalis]